MGQRVGIRQIVDRDDVDGAVVDGGAHDVAADTAEPVDPDFDGHLRLLRAPGEIHDSNERLAWRSNDGLVLFEGLRPSNSPTRSLARRFVGALRSRGSLAIARSRCRYLFTEPVSVVRFGFRPASRFSCS